MTKTKLKKEIGKSSTIIKVTKETKDQTFLEVIIEKGGTYMQSTKEILLGFVQQQTEFNTTQTEFNKQVSEFMVSQTNFNERIESKVDKNTNMIKQAHPDLFKNNEI